MPNYSEYLSALNQEASSLMGFRVSTRYDVQKKAAEQKRRVLKKREEFTKDITSRWKEGFTVLKAENDQMQKDLAQAYRDAMSNISARTLDEIEGLQK